jgi:cytochrome c oxidase assembly factor CtaG
LPFDLTPLGDQQLAGLIMWIPMDVVLFGVAAWLFTAWLRGMDRRRTPAALEDLPRYPPDPLQH